MRHRPRFRTHKNLLAGAGVAIALATAGCSAAASATSNSLPAAGHQGKAAAMSVCHTAVKQQVKPKAGSSPEFAQEKVHQTNYGFVITGQVSAVNSVGTSVQNSYTCSAEENGSTWIAQGVTLSS
jgi:hypothetical protein